MCIAAERPKLSDHGEETVNREAESERNPWFAGAPFHEKAVKWEVVGTCVFYSLTVAEGKAGKDRASIRTRW